MPGQRISIHSRDDLELLGLYDPMVVRIQELANPFDHRRVESTIRGSVSRPVELEQGLRNRHDEPIEFEGLQAALQVVES